MHNRNHRNNQTQRGFTLVELAIVMTIIGLLVAGILKGQEVLQNARTTKMATQLEAIKAATYTYYDTYNFWPGDNALARSRLSNCDASTFCENGDGDGNIGEIDNTLNNLIRGQSGAANLEQMETVQFWKHLALADFIATINAQADPANLALGETHPMSTMIGGYAILTQTASIPGVSNGMYIRLQSAFPENVPGNVVGPNGQNPLSAHSLVKIEEKLDNGDPTTGIILGVQQVDAPNIECGYETNAGGSSFSNPGPNFVFSSREKRCILLYKLD